MVFFVFNWYHLVESYYGENNSEYVTMKANLVTKENLYDTKKKEIEMR